MSQGAYPPGGYEPADPIPPRPEDVPDTPPTRASARVPQPPVWAPPQNAQPFGGVSPPPPPPPQFGGPTEPPAFGSPAQPPQGGYGGPSGGFGGPPPAQPSSGPPSSGRASVPGSPSFGPGTYGTPPGPPPAPAPTYAGPEPSRFANLRYDDPAIEAPRKSKRGLIIGVVIAAVVLLGLAGAGVFLFLNKTSTNASFAVNSCVKKADDKAVAAACTETGAYQIVAKVDTVDKCPDKGQPYVVLQESGKPDQVLCLKPAH
jgi:hypothetical protein